MGCSALCLTSRKVLVLILVTDCMFNAVFMWVSSQHSGLLQMWIWLPGCSKLPLGVNMNVNGCLSLCCNIVYSIDILLLTLVTSIIDISNIN